MCSHFVVCAMFVKLSSLVIHAVEVALLYVETMGMITNKPQLAEMVNFLGPSNKYCRYSLEICREHLVTSKRHQLNSDTVLVLTVCYPGVCRKH